MSVGFETHDHAHCIADGLRAAELECEKQGLQLTPVRRRTLEILLTEHKALGAYDVLGFLRDEGFGSQPPVAYRALDFLVKNGFAHKLEKLNAFVACTHPCERHAPCFLICTSCDQVIETSGRLPAEAVMQSASALGFAVSRVVIEAEGICPRCQEA